MKPSFDLFRHQHYTQGYAKAWLAYEKDAGETGFVVQALFDGLNELEAFVQRQDGELLQPKLASDLKVLVKLMHDNEEEALRVMKEWTVSVGGR